MPKVKVSQWVSQWVREWQGHLLSCCGQLKRGYNNKNNILSRRPDQCRYFATSGAWKTLCQKTLDVANMSGTSPISLRWESSSFTKSIPISNISHFFRNMGSTPPIGYGGPTTKTSGLDLKWFVPTKLACLLACLEQTCIYHFVIGLSLHEPS